jgi:hypothetical protein
MVLKECIRGRTKFRQQPHLMHSLPYKVSHITCNAILYKVCHITCTPYPARYVTSHALPILQGMPHLMHSLPTCMPHYIQSLPYKVCHITYNPYPTRYATLHTIPNLRGMPHHMQSLPYNYQEAAARAALSYGSGFQL